MIGQKSLQTTFQQLYEQDKVPVFSIIVGPEGSGRKTFITEFGAFTNWRVVWWTSDIGSVRDMISMAHKLTEPAIFVLPDADGMSQAARNALLKLAEEPPNRVLLIMTLEDENNTLETIKSRAQIFKMQSYTPDEIIEYTQEYVWGANTKDFKEAEYIIRDICETPGEVNVLTGLDVLDFYEYVERVVTNIATVSGANAFKIANKVALKPESEGYDLKLFWKIFMRILLEYSSNTTDKEQIFKYAEGSKITSEYLKDLRIKGINKALLMDMWILEIRKAWM